jgi:hypothetical protein
MAAGPAWRDHGLIFASETGAPLDPENFSRAFAKLCDRAGLGQALFGAGSAAVALNSPGHKETPPRSG